MEKRQRGPISLVHCAARHDEDSAAKFNAEIMTANLTLSVVSPGILAGIILCLPFLSFVQHHGMHHTLTTPATGPWNLQECAHLKTHSKAYWHVSRSFGARQGSAIHGQGLVHHFDRLNGECLLRSLSSLQHAHNTNHAYTCLTHSVDSPLCLFTHTHTHTNKHTIMDSKGWDPWQQGATLSTSKPTHVHTRNTHKHMVVSDVIAKIFFALAWKWANKRLHTTAVVGNYTNWLFSTLVCVLKWVKCLLTAAFWEGCCGACIVCHIKACYGGLDEKLYTGTYAHVCMCICAFHIEAWYGWLDKNLYADILVHVCICMHACQDEAWYGWLDDRVCKCMRECLHIMCVCMGVCTCVCVYIYIYTYIYIYIYI
jgi:hypothetical protein